MKNSIKAENFRLGVTFSQFQRLVEVLWLLAAKKQYQVGEWNRKWNDAISSGVLLIQGHFYTLRIDDGKILIVPKEGTTCGDKEIKTL